MSQPLPPAEWRRRAQQTPEQAEMQSALDELDGALSGLAQMFAAQHAQLLAHLATAPWWRWRRWYWWARATYTRWRFLRQCPEMRPPATGPK